MQVMHVDYVDVGGVVYVLTFGGMCLLRFSKPVMLRGRCVRTNGRKQLS